MSNIFVSTYEQGVKRIETRSFDDVIINQFHNIFTSNNYKEILPSLVTLIEKKKLKQIVEIFNIVNCVEQLIIVSLLLSPINQ